MLRSFLLRLGLFLIGAVGGALLVLAAAALIGPSQGEAGQPSAATSEPIASIDLDATPQPFTEFELSTDPIPLPTLQPDVLLAVAEATGQQDPLAVADPTGFPRVEPISQFDGGPLQNANCTMAAGAMLARVAYGITTTGSMLRSLQDDQEGGTTFTDLRTALFRGYAVRPAVGLITPQQLRSLASAGFAVAVIGDYGALEPPFSRQPSFTGGHAIYVDGYYPGDAVIGEAFYVIDPLHRPHSGYGGAWWPAKILERFGLSWPAAGRFYSAWAFPTGSPPPRVPRPAGLPPVPEEADVPPPPARGPAGEPGDVEPAEPSRTGVSPGEFEGLTLGEPPRMGGIGVEPNFGLCLTRPPPEFCPSGIPGTIRLAGGLPSISGPPDIEVLWVDSDRPNLVWIGFTAEPDDSSVDLQYWLADGPMEVQVAESIVAMTLDGRSQLVATLPVLAEATYHFRLVAEHAGALAQSEIGAFTSGGGLSSLDITMREADAPVFGVSGLFPYSRLEAGRLASPLLPCDSASEATGGTMCVLSESIAGEMGLDGPIGCRGTLDAGGGSYCLDPVGVGDDLLADGCLIAEVSYELARLDADGVVVRAMPDETYLDADGWLSLRPVVEATSSSSEGTLELGCLTPGGGYQIVVDALGDTSGPLAAEAIRVTP